MSKKEKIEELNLRLADYNKERDRLVAEADELIEKRDRLNERFRNIRLETSKLREERDTANFRVRELKLERSEIKENLHSAIEELKKLRQNVKVLAQTKPQRNSPSLKKELDSIEWKIQTSSLSLEEEKELIEQVKPLEAQLNVYKKLDKIHGQIREIESRVHSSAGEQKSLHNQITQIAQKSQQTHEEMLKKIEEAKKTKTQADEAHRLLGLVREKQKPLKDSIQNIHREINEVKGEIRDEETAERQRNEGLLLEDLEKTAREKLKRGEKLSWEEFQILAEKGLGAQG